MKNHESSPKYPTEKVRENMHFDNNDYDIRAKFNFRTEEDKITSGAAELTNPNDYLYLVDSDYHHVADAAPNPAVELANMQNVHDADERTATEAHVAEIKGSPLRVFKGKELGRSAARLAVIDPNGDMDASHKRFKDNNIDALMENARAAAERAGVNINSGDKAA